MAVPTLDDWKESYLAWARSARLLVGLRADVKRLAPRDVPASSSAAPAPDYGAAVLSSSVMEREELAAWMRTRMMLGAYLQGAEPGPGTLSATGDVRFSIVTVAGPGGTHVGQVIAFLRDRSMVVVESCAPQATRELALAEGRRIFPPREWR